MLETKHDHGHAHHTAHHHHGSSKNIGFAFLLNAGFTVLELIGGLWTNSTAILADAIHDLGDCFALGSAWYLEKLADKKGDDQFSYGYRRFSLLGALISTIALIVGGLLVMTEAVPRLLHPEPVHAPGMVGFAILGIAVNGFAALRMLGQKDMNSRVVTWHLLEDVLGWVAILIVSVVLLFTDAPLLDPLLCVMITLYVLFNVMKNLKHTLNLLLQATPDGLSLRDIESRINELKEVAATHHMHIWSLDGSRHIFTAHLVLHDSADLASMANVKKAVRNILTDYGVNHATIEMEQVQEPCAMAEHDCRQD